MPITSCELLVKFLPELALVSLLDILVTGTHKFPFSLNWLLLEFLSFAKK